ncbi:SDR family oxidoreductase [Streptomyces montanisoli]|uniref:SDR family oxidoreductase n=1 Tax=Streptomyces montanisoli TaxID=2798581 RepID=A0A940RWQ7_9ACTN|nr:SDR family oxidoreductase [Streptomyces montanisoli]MBP0456849.1 SDR family oxidoreductase [Streptomyces montanisoli]
MTARVGRKVAVVTGGSAGVGRATVREFAEHGYDVAVLARGEAGLGGAVRDVEAAGRTGLAIPTDVSDHEEVHRAAERVERELGEIDVWVNTAFAGSLAFFWDTSPEEYRRMTEVTYLGQVNGTRAALEVMRPRNHGVVVNVCSAMSYRSIPLQSAYCGAKHAVKGFTESVMTELINERSKVKVCMIQLPGLNTPQFDWNLNKMDGHPMPVPPVFQPELPARGIVFLAEHPRRNMWVGASTAAVILAERLAPKLVDIYLGRTAVKSQQTGKDAPRFEPNLDRPSDAEADQGAHGAFDDQAHGSDPVLWMSRHRRALLSGLAATATAAAAATVAVQLRGSD